MTSNIVEAIVSIRRLSEFLNAAELQSDARKVIERPFLDLGAEVLSIKSADFSWSKDDIQPTLEDINLSVKKGQLVGVLGQVSGLRLLSLPLPLTRHRLDAERRACCLP